MIETGFFSKIVSDTVHSVGQAAVLWLQVSGSIPVSDYFLYFFPIFLAHGTITIYRGFFYFAHRLIRGLHSLLSAGTPAAG